MEDLHYGEGNGHPHRPPTFVVHTNTWYVAEKSPLEMVHIPATIPFGH